MSKTAKKLNIETVELSPEAFLSVVRENHLYDVHVPDIDDDGAESDMKQLVYRGRISDADQLDENEWVFHGVGTVRVVVDYDRGDFWNPPSVSRADADVGWSIHVEISEDGEVFAEGGVDLI